MQVPFVNLGAQFAVLENELVEAFTLVGRSGGYILGKQVAAFEQGLANICDTRFAVTVANGTDALTLILRAMDIGAGDEVITAPNSFIASAGAIANVGAKPVFVDVGEDYNLDPAKIEVCISDATRAILPIHLTGNPANMQAIMAIAGRFNLKVIEDAAQAIGAEYQGKKVGGLGHAAAFSLHPLKNFHLMGDAGFITTNDEALYERILRLRNHGLINRDESVEWGVNSRLDSMQAAFGNIKLRYLDQWTERFRSIAQRYHQALSSTVLCPVVHLASRAVYHNFVVQVERRTQLMQYLADNGVESKIHYPIPLHLMACSKALGYQKGDFPVAEYQAQRILSLPIYPELTDEQVDYVCRCIQQFYRE